MEHGKFSVSKIWHIAKMEYIKLIMDPRMILIVAALVFAYQFITVPLLQNAAMMGKPINVYEPFVALLNSNFMILLVPAVFLAIMSDYPRIDGNTLFVVQRAGKGNWFFGQILYAQMSILSYLLIVFVGMMIPVLWGGSFSANGVLWFRSLPIRFRTMHKIQEVSAFRRKFIIICRRHLLFFAGCYLSFCICFCLV